MITERDIAEKFSAIWKQNFPLLTPNFMKVFNENQVISVNSFPVLIADNIRYDIISELAFNLANILYVSRIDVHDYLSKDENLKSLISSIDPTSWNNAADKIELNLGEILEIELICNNILEFIGKAKVLNIEFKPEIKGYGLIGQVTADLAIGNTLYEIKTVNRNFKSSDLKQLLIYLSLKQVEGGEKWINAGLYNPRRGVYCKFNINELISKLTGGKSSNEAFYDLLNGLVRDVEIDSKF
nr:hypothetical protein [uncultured Pedobacter sp.]